MLKGKAKCGKGKGKLVFALICFVLIVIAIVVTAKGNRRDVVGYIYDTGNTVWEMAVEHCPEGMEISRFAREIEKANGIVDSVVYSNRAYKIPVYQAKSEYLDMNTVVGYETSDDGLMLLTSDGSGYFIEK